MKKVLLLLVSLLWVIAAFSQGFSPAEIRGNKNAPEFAKLSVQPDVNYFDVLRAFQAYEKAHPVIKEEEHEEAEKMEHEEEEETDPWRFYFKRWNSRVKGWVRSDGSIIDIHTDPVIQQLIQSKQAAATSTAAKPTGLGWRLTGPTVHIQPTGDTANSGANMYCVHFNTSNPAIGFAGSETGYIFKTTDGGENWTLSSMNMIFYGGVRSVATEPNNPNIVYAGDGNGIYKSIDGGATWANIYWGTGVVWSILVNPLRPQTILAATSAGVYQSYDGGTSFALRESGKVNGIEYRPGDTTIVYALITKETPTANYPTGNFYSYVYKSTNGGQAFTQKPSGWYGYLANRQYLFETGDITVSPQSPDVVYALLLAHESDPNNAANTRSSEVGVLKSTNAGESWAFVKGPWQTPNMMTFPWTNNSFAGDVYWQGDYNNWIIANPANSNEVVVGGLSGYRSTDGGSSWTNILGYSGLYGSHPDHQNFFMSGNTLWITNDGGILKSNDFLATAPKVKSKGIYASEFWGFDVGWNQEIVTGGRYHNGNASFYQGINPDKTFTALGGGEAATGYVSPYESDVYHSDIGGYKLLPTFPNVQSIPNLTQYPNETYSLDMGSNIIYHPNKKRALYLGNGNSLWRSSDEGTSFTSLYTFPNQVLDFDIPLSAPDTIMLATWQDSKLWRSVDGGNSFTDVTGTLPAGLKRISMNPLNAKECWVLIGGGSSVYRTTDAGNTWTSVGGGNMTGYQGFDIFVQGSTADPTCYVACNTGGVFYKNNSTGGNWTVLNQDLPLAHVVRRLKPFYNKNKMFFATSGIGIWEHDLMNSVQPFANFASTLQTVNCSKDTLTFYDYSIVDESVAAATRTWSFPGAAYVNTSDPKHPKVLYNTPGNYNVGLTVTDANNASHARTISNFITFSANDICKVDTTPGLALTTNPNGTSVIDIGKVPINSNNFTISFWVKPNGNQASFSQILSTSAPNTNFGLNFSFQGYTPNLNLVYTHSSIAYWLTSSIELDNNLWNYITFVYTASGVTIYKNGQAPGWAYTTGPFPSIDLNSGDVFINKDINGQGSAFKGEIDEVAFYNTALALDQIREQMHLTKNVTTPNLVKYIQFNQYVPNEAILYDAIGSASGSVPAANMTASDAAVGGGTVQTLNNVNTAGAYTFGNTGMSITLPNSGTYPNGTLVGFKLNVPPDTKPSADSTFPGYAYWIINNYGSNATFSALSNIKFSGLPKNPTYPYTNNEFKLFKRSSVAYGNTWGSMQDASDLVTVNPNSIDITFSAGNNITSFSQLVMTANNPVVLHVRDMKLTAHLNNSNSAVKLDGHAELDEKIQKLTIERMHNNQTTVAAEKNVAAQQSSVADISHLDSDIQPGNDYYYRLIATSIDEAQYYGTYQRVNVPILNAVFNAFPNPANDWITFSFSGSGATTGTISIHNAEGRLVKLLNNLPFKNGDNKVMCNVSELASGIYEASLLLNNGQSFRVKISKRK